MIAGDTSLEATDVTIEAAVASFGVEREQEKQRKAIKIAVAVVLISKHSTLR